MTAETRAIGVLYLDSREKGQLLVAGHPGRPRHAGQRGRRRHRERPALPRDAGEGAHRARAADRRRDPALAAARRAGASGTFFQAMGASLPSRSIGGDFFEYTDMDDGAIGVILGDVAGKGPAAALLTAKIQGLFSAQSGDGSPAVGDEAGQQRPAQAADRRPLRHRVLRDADGRGRADLLQRRPQPAGRGAPVGRSPAGVGQRAGRAVLERDLLRRTHPARSGRRPGDLQRRRHRGAQRGRRRVRRRAAGRRS